MAIPYQQTDNGIEKQFGVGERGSGEKEKQSVWLTRALAPGLGELSWSFPFDQSSSSEID